MKRRYLLALALTVALALTAQLFWTLWPARPEEAPPPSPVASFQAQGQTLALLGSSADLKCAPLYDTLEEWARANGWAFVSYDCYGWAVSQKGQVEDLLAHEKADVAVLYAVGSQEELDGWAKALSDGGCRVITLGQAASAQGEKYVDCHMGLSAQALRKAVTDQMVPDFLGQRREVLLVVDVPEDPSAQRALDALEGTVLNVVEYGACWGQSQYAREYLEGALERHPHVSAIFCLSHAGAQGAREAMGSREDTAVLALDCSPALVEDVALGEVDAAAGLSLTQAAGQLTQAIPKVAQGTHLGRVALDAVTVTGENVQSVELGYDD